MEALKLHERRGGTVARDFGWRRRLGGVPKRRASWRGAWASRLSRSRGLGGVRLACREGRRGASAGWDGGPLVGL